MAPEEPAATEHRPVPSFFVLPNTPTCVRSTHTSSPRNATAWAFGRLEVAGEGNRRRRSTALPDEASVGRFGDRPYTSAVLDPVFGHG
jgi:hypothetical protein